MAAVTADSVVVNLELRNEEYNRRADDSAKRFSNAMNSQAVAAKRAEAEIARAASNKALQESSSASKALAAAQQRQRAAAAEISAAQRTLAATNQATQGKASAILGARRAAQAALDEARRKEQAATREVAASQKAATAAERAAQQKIAAANRAAAATERAVNQEVRAQARASAQAERASGGGGAGRGIGRLGGVVAGAATGYLSVQTARQYLELADAAKTLNAQLNLATAESGNFAQAQEDVSRIARETRSGLAETAQLYGTFQRNAAQLGITQEQSARATETITKSFQISGATAQEAAGGLRQFLQALQSGTLRGEEFNSIVENAPRLAKLLADQLSNGNVGALRELSQAGKITSQELTRALTDPSFTSKIDEEFKQLPVTFEQAMTLVKNAAIETFGAFDQGGQFSTALANFVSQGSDGFAGLAKDAEQAGINIRADFEGLRSAFQPMLDAAFSAFGQIEGRAQSSAEYVRGLLALIDDARNAPANLVNGFGEQTGLNRFRAGRRVLGTGEFAPNRSNMAGDFTRGQQETQRRLQGEARDRRVQARFGGNSFQRYLNEPDKYDMFGNLLKATTAPRAIAAGGAGGGRASGGGGRSTVDKAAREAERAAEEARRNQERFNDDMRRADDRILSAQLRNAQTIEEREQLARRQIERDLESETIGINRLVTEGRISQADADLLIAKAKELSALEGIALSADLRLEREREQQAKAGAIADLRESELRLELQMATNNAQRFEIEKRLIDARFNQLKAVNDAVIADQNATDAAKELARLANLRIENERAASKAGLTADARGSYDRYRDRLSDADALGEDIDNLKIQTLEAVTDELTNATKAALGLKGAFGDIVGELIRIGIQRKLIGPLADALFGKQGGESGGGVLGSLLGSIIGGAPGRASGGNVMAGKAYMTGENGRELFVPSQSGKIYPTGALNAAASRGGGGTTVIQNISVDSRNSVTPAGFARQLLTQANGFAANASKTAYDASPARLAKSQALGT